MFQPGRLPGHGGNQVGRGPQALSDVASGGFGFFRVAAFHGNDQLPGVGEVLLMQFQPVNRGDIREEVQYFHVEMKPRQTDRDRNEQQEPDPSSGMFQLENLLGGSVEYAFDGFPGFCVDQYPGVAGASP